MDKSDKIYIAGHTGLVGSAIKRKLENEGYKNLIIRTSAELDLTDQKETADFFLREKPDYVFLAAAKVGGILANRDFPADFIYKNLQIETNVIHESFINKVKKLLFLGSSCIYPRECPQPIKEEYLLTGPLEPTNEPYAIAKIAGIKMCQSYNRQYKTDFISAMPTNLYGPNDNFDLATSHVLPAMIRKFHEAKSSSRQGGTSRNNECGSSELNKDRDVELWGSGSPKREFLHVDDLVDACVFLMENYDDSEIVNIGTGEDITIKELAETIQNVVGHQGQIKWDASKPDGTPQKLMDVEKLYSLGWKHKINIEDGIKRTYQWYLDNQPD